VKALVIEDSRTSQAMIAHLLRDIGIEPVQAENGLRGLELYAERRPDLILLDVVLPDIDGLEVARRVRAAEGPGDWTPIVFLTGRTSDADLEAGIEAGGDDYLVKPLNPIVFAAKVRAMSRIAQMRDKLLETTHQLDQVNRELMRLSAMDGLTGLANRRHFDSVLRSEWDRGERRRHPVSLLMCDVDFFKPYNDSYGHLQGDECLRRVSSALQFAIRRPCELAARYGGEEFALLLPETNAQQAMEIAETVRSNVERLAIPHGQSPKGVVSISIGVATRVPSAQLSPERLIALADKALYIAKKGGRDRAAQAVGGASEALAG
jgi:diguanylate cyclase (GGDEF)-like protein